MIQKQEIVVKGLQDRGHTLFGRMHGGEHLLIVGLGLSQLLLA